MDSIWQELQSAVLLPGTAAEMSCQCLPCWQGAKVALTALTVSAGCFECQSGQL